MLEPLITALESAPAAPGPLLRAKGRVQRVTGEMITVSGCDLGVGERCVIELPDHRVTAEVVGLAEDCVLLQPLGPLTGVRQGALVLPLAPPPEPRADALTGRVLNGLLEPLDEGPPLPCSSALPAPAAVINPLQRRPITTAFDTGVRAIDALVTVGEGQRLGIFAGSGVGKSVLLGMICRFARADAVVVGLIGERGREVREFVEENLGVGLGHSVVVAAPADDAPVMRIRAAFAATQIAERLRDAGKRVLLVMDSLTRVAQAQREIGLAAGEPPSTKGYTPSAFRMLPRLVERAGAVGSKAGSITALYTVLTEEDDLQEAVADACRAILDGHLVLDRALGEAGVYPAIDVGASISRVMTRIAGAPQQEQARQFRELWSRYREQEDLINVGAYQSGTDPVTDRAIALQPRLREFVRQDMAHPVPREQALAQLADLLRSPPRAPAAAPSPAAAAEARR